MDMDIEKALAKIDEDGSRVIKKLEKQVGEPGFIDACYEPDGDELTILLHYASVMYLRNPTFRRSLGVLMNSQATLEMRLKAWSYAGVEELEKELTEAGEVLPPEIDARELLEWIKSPESRIEVDDPDWLLVQSLMPEEAVLKLLAERNWRLWCAERGGGYFVTSDRPMVLMWREAHPVGFRPGFAHRDTHVIFPLTKHLLLYGSYDRDSALIEAGRDTIAVANHAIVGTCALFIYSTDASFSEMSDSVTTQSPGEYLRTRLW